MGLLATILTPLLLIIRLFDIHYSFNFLPEIGQGAFSTLWWLWGIQQFIENFLWTIFWILIASMFSDIVEQQELKTNLRLDGFVLSANNFINKTILSGGLLVSGVILTLVGFDTAITITEKEFAAFKLGIFSVATIFVLLPIAIFFVSKYQISKHIHQVNLKKLSQKSK